MDHVGARNALIILLTIVTLTFLSLGVALYMYLDAREVPAALMGIVTTFVGFLTGTQVNFGSRASVDAGAKAADEAAGRVHALAQSFINAGQAQTPDATIQVDNVQVDVAPNP